MVEPYNIDDAIREYIEENDGGDGVGERELINEVCPRPKCHASYALVLVRLQSLEQGSPDVYRPTPEPRYKLA